MTMVSHDRDTFSSKKPYNSIKVESLDSKMTMIEGMSHKLFPRSESEEPVTPRMNLKKGE